MFVLNRLVKAAFIFLLGSFACQNELFCSISWFPVVHVIEIARVMRIHTIYIHKKREDNCIYLDNEKKWLIKTQDKQLARA